MIKKHELKKLSATQYKSSQVLSVYKIEAMFNKMAKIYRELRNTNLWPYYKTYEPGNREVEVIYRGKQFLMFSNNNYLGLARSKKVIDKCIEVLKVYGVGTGASLAVTGCTGYHSSFEEKIANFYGYESAKVFSSGYMANSAIVSALADPNTMAFCDKFVHKSFINAFILNDIPYIRYKHNDPEDLVNKMNSFKLKREKKRHLIITESIFSQHGEIARVDELSKIARRYDAILIVDDAHGLGTIGKRGWGILDEFNLDSSQVDVITGAMNKSLGTQGGYIVANRNIIDVLEVKASELIFTSSLPAVSAVAAIVALDEIRNNLELYSRLRENVIYCRNEFEKLGIALPTCVTPIIPIVIGDETRACQISSELMKNRIIAMPIIPPGVPKGMSRIRIQITAAHEKADIDKLVSALGSIMQMSIMEGIIRVPA